jgi:NAD(P)-dependent dehydrogenase (short-subunit alcohol dehydrogenase family)
MTAGRRTVFITGCSSGIGRAAAMVMARAGYRVVATARKPDSLSELTEWAVREKLFLQTTVCDVTDDESVGQAVAFSLASFGPIEILVNNAGYGALGPIEAVAFDEARRQMDVNVFGAMRLVKAVAPEMRSAGWGRIINVSSVAGRMAIPLGGWYSASKFALEALTDTLRLELEPFGIQTVSILPGPVQSDFLVNVSIAGIPEHLPDRYRSWIKRIERRRDGRSFEVTADHVAHVILKAAGARRPRTRYVITIPARVGLAIRPFLSDRAWDWVLRRFYGLNNL